MCIDPPERPNMTCQPLGYIRHARHSEGRVVGGDQVRSQWYFQAILIWNEDGTQHTVDCCLLDPHWICGTHEADPAGETTPAARMCSATLSLLVDSHPRSAVYPAPGCRPKCLARSSWDTVEDDSVDAETLKTYRLSRPLALGGSHLLLCSSLQHLAFPSLLLGSENM